MTVLLVGIGAVLLGLAAGVVGLHIADRIRLGRKIAELRAQGIPTSYAELEAFNKLPEGTPNAADVYIRAFKAYRPLPDTEKQKLLPVFGEGPEPKEGEPYPDDQIRIAAEFIELNQEMFHLLHQARQVKSCCYPLDYTQRPIPELAIFEDIRKINDALIVSIIYYRQTNQPQKAYESLLDQLRLGRCLSSNLTLIAYIVRLNIYSIGISQMEEIISRSMPDDSQLRLLQDEFQQLSQSVNINRPLLGEICFCIENFGFWTANMAIRMLFYKHPVRYCIAFLLPKNPAQLIESYQQLREVETLPIEKQLPKARDILKQKDNSWYSNMAGRVAMNSFEAIFERVHLCGGRVRMDCAIAALAIERYRIKEKKLPQTIEELVPEYLAGVSINPFDGKPLRYEQADPGYRVYMVCEEGLDKEEEKPDKFDWRQMRTYVFEVKR